MPERRSSAFRHKKALYRKHQNCISSKRAEHLNLAYRLIIGSSPLLLNAVIVQKLVDPSMIQLMVNSNSIITYYSILILARIAVLDRSITMTGSKRGIPPFLKKFGSATANPRVETSIVWTRTLRFLNSLALVASKLEYFWS